MNAKILLLDLETAPNLGWVWGKYDQTVIEFEQDWYILAVGWQWLGEEDEPHVRCLPDYADTYRTDPASDKALVRDLWALFDRADIIVAHNGDAFDIKRSNARFIGNGLPPPSLYKSVDTLKIARKHFKFESNKLHDLGEHLGLGGKLGTAGFKTWRGCMNGDVSAWQDLAAYNVRDVQLLHDIFLKLRPWADALPDLNMYELESKEDQCPKCGSIETERRGHAYARTQVRQRWHCKSCGAWYSGKIVRR